MQGPVRHPYPTGLMPGDVVNNGVYDIKLVDYPHFNDAISRWQAKGKRWVTSKKRWQNKPKLYGWDIPFLPRHSKGDQCA